MRKNSSKEIEMGNRSSKRYAYLYSNMRRLYSHVVNYDFILANISRGDFLCMKKLSIVGFVFAPT